MTTRTTSDAGPRIALRTRPPRPARHLGHRPRPPGHHRRWLLLIVGLGALRAQGREQPRPAPAGRPTARSPSRRASSPRSTSAATPPPPSRSSCTPPTARSPRAPAPQVLAEATAHARGRPPDRRRHRTRSPAPPSARTARPPIVLAGAGADTNEMVRAADDLKGPLQDALRRRHRGQPDRRVAAVVGLQRGQPRRDAEVGDVLLAGDAGDPGARLRRAGRRRPAAAADPGRARRLGRLAGADQRARPGLDLGDELRDDVRPRARHRLRPVPRRPLPRRPDGRSASTPAQAVAETMDTAGKAVLLSGADRAGLACPR